MQPGDNLLRVMRSRLGVREIPGEEADNPVILAWFAAVGHPEIRHDEVSWCAVTVGSALVECGLPIPPRDCNMLARSYLTYGRRCEPQPGAIAIWPRGAKWQGHVNVVESVFADGTVICIGGNQSAGPGGDSVTRTRPMQISQALDFRMPVPATVAALRDAGSTEIAHGDKLQNVGTISVAAGPAIAVAKHVATSAPDPTPVASALEHLSTFQQIMGAANAVGELVLSNPWLAGSVGGGLAIAYLGHTLKRARVDKHAAGVPLSAAVAGMADDLEPARA